MSDYLSEINTFVKSYPAAVTAGSSIIVFGLNYFIGEANRKKDKASAESKKFNDRNYSIKVYKYQKFVLEQLTEIFDQVNIAAELPAGSAKHLQKFGLSQEEKTVFLRSQLDTLYSIGSVFESKYLLLFSLVKSSLSVSVESLWEEFMDGVTREINDVYTMPIDQKFLEKQEKSVAKKRLLFIESLVDLIHKSQPQD